MNTGAVLYAFDGEICYTNLAVECAKRIKKHLDLPVTLITDREYSNSIFDNVVVLPKRESTNGRYWHDTKKSTSWLNHSRSRAYELSPYDKTLLLDVDYLVDSTVLNSLLQADGDFYAHRTARNVNGIDSYIDTFGTKNMDMWWATLVIFRKSSFSQDVFAVWQMVETHWNYYSQMFSFRRKQFRNDWALSIALLAANGNTVPLQCDIPWPLLNAQPEVEIKFNADHIDVYYTKQEKNTTQYKRIIVKDQDIHVMGKSYLEGAYVKN